jgi:Ca-activated chloride channel family protein
MKFAQPSILCLMALLPLLAVFFIVSFRMKRRLLDGIIAPAMQEKLISGLSFRREKTKLVLLFLVFIFLLLAWSGPLWGSRLVEVKQKGLDVFIAIDCSLSMNARDIKPDRLTRAKADMKDLIMRLQPNRIGIIAFSGSAFVQCPLTMDVDAALMFVDLIEPGLIPVPGTAVGEAIRLAARSFPSKEPRYKALVLLTDGEDHSSKPLEAAQEAARDGIRIFTIGFGSTRGEPIPVLDEKGTLREYKKNRSGEMVLSKLNEADLIRIASVTRGEYYRAAGGGIAVDRVTGDILSMEKRQLKDRWENEMENRFQFPLVLALALLLWEFFLPERKDPGKAGALIKIKSLLTLGFMLLLLQQAAPSWASPAGSVQKGCKLYNRGKYPEADSAFKKGLEKNPESHLLHFNDGAALYRMGKFQDAAAEFTRAASSTDKGLRARALYNLGNSLYRAGKEKEALSAFKDSIITSPDDADARFNYEFLRKKMEDGKKKEEPSPSSSPSPRPSAATSPSPTPSPGGMSKEDAERLLNALKDDEKKALKERKVPVLKMPRMEEDW